MLEATSKQQSARRWRYVVAAHVLAILALSAFVLVYATSTDNATRVRNSLIADVADRPAFVWTPDAAPEAFVFEHDAVPPALAEAVEGIFDDRNTGSGFDAALSISRHMVANRQEGGGIRSGDTLLTYAGIRDGRGYCADYSRVFTAFSTTSGIAVRAWGFGLDGFGEGHAFNEIYDPELGKWVFVDSFYSLYVLDRPTSVPLSVMEFRDALADGLDGEQLEVVPINRDRFAFRSADAAIEYYREGSDQFYLNWGTSAFNFETLAAARFLAGLPRPIEVFGSIILGLRPDIVILKTPTNQPHVDKLIRTRWIFLGSTALLLTLGCSLLWQLWSGWRRSRR